MITVYPEPLKPEPLKSAFLRFLNLSGDGSVTNCEITGNYAATPTDFYFTPPAGKIYRIATIMITISDNASFNQTDYGAIVGGLTNGIKLIRSINGVETQLIGGFTIKQNYQFLATTHSINLTTFAGTAQTLTVEFDTFSSLGTYIELNNATSDKLILRVNDDFTTLISHKVTIRGIIM